MRLRKLILTLTIAVSAMSAFADTAPCIVNIINFVRKTEPRINAAEGAQYAVTLKEKDITASSGRGNGYCLELTTAQGAKTPFARIAPKGIAGVRDGFAYSTKLKSDTFTDLRGTPGEICRINPEEKGIVLHLAQK